MTRPMIEPVIDPPLRHGVPVMVMVPARLLPLWDHVSVKPPVE
jgi:hypothetical protein